MEEEDFKFKHNELLDTGRRLARRRMAWLSFIFLLVLGTAIMVGLLVRTDPTLFAQALATASGVLTGLLTVFTTIVLGYLGVSVAESVLKRK